MENNKSEISNKKMNIYKTVCFVLAMLIIIIAYLIINQLIKNSKDIERKEAFVQIENQDILYHIDNARYENGNLIIEGWAFYLGVNAVDQRLTIFLRDINDYTNKFYFTETKINRNDVNDYYLCDYDYTNCGFEALLYDKKLSSECYEILINVSYSELDERTGTRRENSITISTYKYITNGELMACRKDMYDPIESNNTYINNIVDNGDLIFYRRNKGIYLYQYFDKLYWITNKNYEFSNDGRTYIQYQLRTTQTDLLPSSRINNKYDWDNLGFVFEENEYREENFGEYRVASCRIPNEYAVTYFWTGYCVDNKWKWMEYVHLGSIEQK